MVGHQHFFLTITFDWNKIEALAQVHCACLVKGRIDWFVACSIQVRSWPWLEVKFFKLIFWCHCMHHSKRLDEIIVMTYGDWITALGSWCQGYSWKSIFVNSWYISDFFTPGGYTVDMRSNMQLTLDSAVNGLSFPFLASEAESYRKLEKGNIFTLMASAGRGNPGAPAGRGLKFYK